MAKFKIAGHVFEGKPSFIPLNYEKGIGVVIPDDTEKSVIAELQDAALLEILDPKTEEIVGSYRLTGWRSIEHVYSNGYHGIALVWTTVNLDVVSQLQQRIEELEEANASLISENATLEDGLLELAELLGGEEENFDDSAYEDLPEEDSEG